MRVTRGGSRSPRVATPSQAVLGASSRELARGSAAASRSDGGRSPRVATPSQAVFGASRVEMAAEKAGSSTTIIDLTDD